MRPINEMLPYNSLLLDCYQNLLLSYINFYEKDYRFLGAIWPWQFEETHKFEQEHDRPSGMCIKNSNCITKDKISSMYGIHLELGYFSGKDVIGSLKHYTKQNLPVIVAFDQYYVHYHYNHIYRKAHGFHTLLVLDVNDKTNDLDCLDVIPTYRGVFSENEFIEGVTYWGEEAWYEVLRLQDNKVQINEEKLWLEFYNQLLEIKRQYRNRDNDYVKQDGYMYTIDIVKILENILKIKDTQERHNALTDLCSGAWGWEIDRRGMFFLQYLKLPFFYKKLKNYTLIEELVKEVNTCWMLAFRFLFKGTQVSIEAMLEKAIKKLNHAIELEIKILDELLENM